MAVEIEPEEMSEAIVECWPVFLGDKRASRTDLSAFDAKIDMPESTDEIKNLSPLHRETLGLLIGSAFKEIRAIAATEEMKTQGRTGATVIISNESIELAPLILEVDEVNQDDKDFGPGKKNQKHWVIGLAKNRFTEKHPPLESAVNLEDDTGLPKWKVNGELVPGGAVYRNGWSVAVSGFVGKNDKKSGETDEAAAIAILFGAGQFDSFQKAKSFANNIKNERFVKDFDLFVNPIL